MRADHHVLEKRSAWGREREILERPADPEPGDLVGGFLREERGALETWRCPPTPCRSRLKQLNRVVLPAPFGPIKPTICRGLDVRNETPSSARRCLRTGP